MSQKREIAELSEKYETEKLMHKLSKLECEGLGDIIARDRERVAAETAASHVRATSNVTIPKIDAE